MPLIIRLILLTLIAGAAAGCSGNHEPGKDTGNVTPVPRRQAYPRIEIPDSAYTDITAGTTTIHIAVNEAAIVTLRTSDDGNSQFVDTAYPKFNSTIFFTVTPVDRTTVADVIANRMERVRLNLGASDAELLEFDSPGGFENKLFVSRGDISTPVQFVATDGNAFVVSGAAFVRDASPVTADSIAPIVNMLRRDILHALKTMHR